MAIESHDTHESTAANNKAEGQEQATAENKQAEQPQPERAQQQQRAHMFREPPPKSPFMQAVENEWHERRFAQRGPGQWNDAYRNMSPEERRDEEDRQAMRHALNRMAQSAFDMVIGNGSWPAVRYIPVAMASQYVIGTNTAMRMIVSNDVTEARMAAVKELTDEYRGLKIEGLGYLHMVNEDPNKPRSLAECYWLLELCRYLKCVHAEFEAVMKKALDPWESVDELEFIAPFNLADNHGHRLLQLRSQQQYEQLDALLKRL